MARISFSQVSSNNESTGYGNKPAWFSLKNDGDSAIVRFMHDTVDDFDILSVHPVTINGKYVKANCIREDASQPLSDCPLCEAGVALQQRMYVHLIEYVKDQNGQIVPVAKVWDRPVSFARALKTKIDTYGPLSDCLFKVTRCGAANNMSTTYNVDYAPPQVYNPELFRKENLFEEGYTASGSVIMNKSYEELAYFVKNNEFPPQKKEQAEAPAFNAGTPSDAINDIYANMGVAAAPRTPSNDTAVERPRRVY